MAKRKVLTSEQFRATITNMVKEELKKVLKEQTEIEDRFASILKHVKDISAFKNWIFRTYFGEKNKGKRWYDPSVTPENVLSALVKPNSPISPRGAVEVWKNMPAIQKGLASAEAEKELSQVAKLVGGEEPEDKTTYTKGVETLKAMSKGLGDVTPTMVNKLFAGGAEKMKKLTGGMSLEDMSDEQLEDLVERIDIAREETAEDFATLLKASHGNTKNFLDALVKSQILTPGELELLSDDEVGGLTMLAGKSKEEIEAILLADIEDDDNLFKTFQNAVSKRVFPPGKRGRPPGSKNKPGAPAGGEVEEP